jgi:outer membrane protein TolC
MPVTKKVWKMMICGRESALRAWGLFWAVAGILLLSGCTAASYRKTADNQAYGIVKQYQGQVLGESNKFNIDTAYSARKPADISPAELIDDRRQTNQRVLTVEEAIDLGVKNSPTYQRYKEDLYTTALNLSSERNKYSPQLAASGTGTWNRNPDDSRSGSVGSKLEASQTWLLRTGGKVTVDALNNFLRYYIGSPQESVASTLSATFAQPLLRGFGRNNDAIESLTQAERNVVYAVRNYSYNQDQFALGVANAYFSLLVQKDAIRNRYTNYLARVQATKRLEARAVDREAMSSVDTARQAELSAKNSYVDAVASYRTALDAFKIRLGVPVGDKVYLDDTALDEVEKTGLVPASVDSDLAYRLAVQKQLQILISIDQFEDAKRKVRIAADKLKPGLDLTSTVSLQSQPPTDYARFNADEAQANAVLQLSLPVNRVPLANTYRAALITFESSLRAFTGTLDTLKQNIVSQLLTLDQRRQTYQIQKVASDLANRRLFNQTLLLEAGRATVLELVDAQNAQIDALNAVTQALLDYQSARLQLMLVIGALDTEKPKFWLADHLAGFLPGGTPGSTQSVAGPGAEQLLMTPEESFKN